MFVCNNVWCDGEAADPGLTGGGAPGPAPCFTLDPYGSGSWVPPPHHAHHPSSHPPPHHISPSSAPHTPHTPHWCERERDRDRDREASFREREALIRERSRSQEPPSVGLGATFGGSFSGLGGGREVLAGAPLGGCHSGSLRQLDSPYHVTCPVHSPYRYRFANGGPEFYGHHHQVIEILNMV